MKIKIRSFSLSDLIILGLFILFTLIMTAPLVFHLSETIPADLGDPVYTIWALNWEIHQAGRGFAHFFDANNFFPHTGTLLYADYVPALALMAAPVFWLTGSMIPAYNIVFLFSFILCAWGSYRLVLYLFKNRPAAFLSGLIFAFFTYRFAHLSHIELLMFGWMPLFFLSLCKWIDRPAPRHILGVGIYFVLQTWSCAYYGAYFAPFAFAGMVYFGLKTGAFRRPGTRRSLLLLALVTVPFLVAFYLPFVLIHQKMIFVRGFGEVLRYSAELQYFVSVTRETVFWKWLFHSQASGEWILYPGLVVLILTLAGAVLYARPYRRELRAERKTPFILGDGLIALVLLLGLQIRRPGGKFGEPQWLAYVVVLAVLVAARLIWTWRKRPTERILPPTSSLAVRFFLFSGAAAFLLSLGVQARLNDRPLFVGPYLLFYKFVPGFQGLRAPGRIAVVMMLALAVLSGWSFVRMTAKIRRPKVRAGLAGLTGFLILADFAAFPIRLAEIPTGEKIPPIYRAVRDLPDSAALIELPTPSANWSLEDWRDVLPMYYSTFHGKRIANGYSGYYPPGYTILRDAMTNFPEARTLRLLRDLGIDYVLVHTLGHRAPRGQEILKALTGLPDETELKASVDGDYLFHLLPAALPPAPRIGVDVGDRKTWRISTKTNLSGARAVIDGNPDTNWVSKGTQDVGRFIEIDLLKETEVSQIELRQGRDPLGYPRAFIVEGQLAREEWFPLKIIPVGVPDVTAATIEDIRNYRMLIDFPPRIVCRIRIRLTYPHRTQPWSIQEIYIRRPADAP